MPTFTLIYADHNDPDTTIELAVEAIDNRFAMGAASDLLAQEAGQNAWVLQSITEAPPVTETADPEPES